MCSELMMDYDFFTWGLISVSHDSCFSQKYLTSRDRNSGFELEEKGMKMTETVTKIIMESDRMRGLYGTCGSRYLK